MTKAQVLVLGGGPDAEREVSLAGAQAVCDALNRGDRYAARFERIERIDASALSALPGDVIFPALHGPWGEGGPFQDVLSRDGRPFVGSGPRTARLAMDKMATKLLAAIANVQTPPACAVRTDDPVCPLPFPVVVKPVHEGSTIALAVCHDEASWQAAWEKAREQSWRSWMVEPFIEGRELTVGVLGDEALPLIEIAPAGGLYDYEAKYARDDTRYVVNPDLPSTFGEIVQEQSVRMARMLGVRHLARVDFIFDAIERAWLLEVNTMPGFTDHSLLPMAAAARPSDPLDMPALCARLVDLALAESTLEATS